MGFCQDPEGARCEGRHSSEVPRRRGQMRLRRDMEDPVDQARAAPRNLLELPSVLYRQAEADRHRGPRRAVYEEVRRADVREPEEGRKGGEGEEGQGKAGNSNGSPLVFSFLS